MDGRADVEALALLELDGLPRALRIHDAVLKKAPVEVLACTPTSPGKAIVLFVGDVASVEIALAEAKALAGSRLIDHMMLPGVHAEVVLALRGEKRPRGAESLAILETSTVAATLLAADAARKAALVNVGRMHLASGFGGKGYFTLWGGQSDVEAAVEAAVFAVGDKITDQEIIAAPHDELEIAAFKRPWNLDPAGD